MVLSDKKVMRKFSLFFLFQCIFLAFASAEVTLPSGDCFSLPSGWMVTETTLLKKKILYLQYRKTNLHASGDTDFLVNRIKASPLETFKSKCKNTKDFFSNPKNQVTLTTTANTCKIQIISPDQQVESILLKLSRASTPKILAINAMSIARRARNREEALAARNLETAFYAMDASKGKCAR